MWYETPTPDHRPSTSRHAARPLVRFDSDGYAKFNEQLEANLVRLETRWKNYVTQYSLDRAANGRHNRISRHR